MAGAQARAAFAGEALACVRGEKRVFEGLSFAVAGGEALVVRGPNGSGKSSLLRLMAMLLRPAAGSLLWQGVPVTDDADAHRARIAYLGHLDAVKPALSAAENLRFWAALRGTARRPVVDALEALGIKALADVPVRELSAGQRRRVALARLLVAPAALWLLDEPSVSLDHRGVATLEALIRAQRDGGGIVIIATHVDLGLADARTLDVSAFAPARARAAA